MDAQGLVLYQWAENGWQGMGSTGTPVKSPEIWAASLFGLKSLRFTPVSGMLSVQSPL